MNYIIIDDNREFATALYKGLGIKQELNCLEDNVIIANEKDTTHKLAEAIKDKVLLIPCQSVGG